MTYQITFHLQISRSFDTFSTLYHTQAQVHLHPSTRSWCLDLSTKTVSHTHYHEHQLILVKETNTKNKRSKINCTVTQEDPQTSSPSSTAKFQTDNHMQHSTLDHNDPILYIVIQQEPNELKATWILIKRLDGLPVKTTSTNFDSWEVTYKDQEYRQTKIDIPVTNCSNGRNLPSTEGSGNWRPNLTGLGYGQTKLKYSRQKSTLETTTTTTTINPELTTPTPISTTILVRSE